MTIPSTQATAGVDDATWTSLIRARLRRWAPRILPGGPRVLAIESLAPDVWRLRLSDGGTAVAKHQLYGLLTRDEPYDLLATEVDVLRALRRAGCCVPVPFGFDRTGQLLLLEYVGRRTLGDVLLAPDAAAWVCLTASALQRIEEQLAASAAWLPRVVPGARRGDLQQAWHQVEAPVQRGLRRWLTAMGQPRLYESLAPILHRIHERLGRRAPSLGPVDYQPGNIVLGDACHRLAFLELGKLGWDWTERRALQYTTPLVRRAHTTRRKVDGGVAAATAARLQALATALPGAAQRAALDGHHLMLQLLLAERDGGRGHLLDLLHQRLSDDPLMAAWRRHLPPLGSAPPHEAQT